MGQAQSQSIYDPSCDDCYSVKEPENLKERNLKDSSGPYWPGNHDAKSVSLHNLQNPQYSISPQSVPVHIKEGIFHRNHWPLTSLPANTHDEREPLGGNSNPSGNGGSYSPSSGQAIQPFQQADLRTIGQYPYGTGNPLFHSEPRDTTATSGHSGGVGRDKAIRDYVPKIQEFEAARNPAQRYDQSNGKPSLGTGILHPEGERRNTGGIYLPDNGNAAAVQGHHGIPEEKRIPGAEISPRVWHAPSGTNVNYGRNPVGVPINNNQNHLNGVPLQNGRNTGIHQLKPESVPPLGTGVYTAGPDGQTYVCCVVNPSQYGPSGATIAQGE